MTQGPNTPGRAPPPPASTPAQDDWVRLVLGTDPTGGSATPNQRTPSGRSVQASPNDPARPLTQAARDPQVWTRSVGVALTRQGPDKTGARIEAAAPAGPSTTCTAPNGRTVSIVNDPDGRVALTRDPAPITEVTFPGGGGKGVALPGVIRALSESGVLATTKEVHGSSVGSMTAALVAAGISPDAYQHLAQDTDFSKLIKGTDLLPIHESGNKLEQLVKNAMRSAIEGHIAKFAETAMRTNTKVDPKTIDTLAEMSKRFGAGNQGPTFMDLRVLSKIIPEIKEVVITGTLIGKSAKHKPGAKSPEAKPPKEDLLHEAEDFYKNLQGADPSHIDPTKPELIIFSADTQPNLPVARAVHASAALPIVFNPVDIRLASGEIGRFEDGGVLNNAPSSDTLGTDRDIDPVPETGKLTFVFDSDASNDLIRGQATPRPSLIRDLMGKAPSAAADYAKNRTLADAPQDVVVVPLKFARADGTQADFSTALGGTVNFNISKPDQAVLRAKSEAATLAHLKKSQQRETREFASVAQMFACTTREDLVAMAASKYPGAQDALQFRDTVTQDVTTLETLAAQGATLSDPKVAALLKSMNASANGDEERIGFIGRALNRSGKLDALLASLRHGAGAPQLDALAAGEAVAAVVTARKAARAILRDAIYPQMIREKPNTPASMLLAQMDTRLRDAKSSRQINTTLQLGIGFFAQQPDLLDFHGYHAFVKTLIADIQTRH